MFLRVLPIALLATLPSLAWTSEGMAQGFITVTQSLGVNDALRLEPGERTKAICGKIESFVAEVDAATLSGKLKRGADSWQQPRDPKTGQVIPAAMPELVKSQSLAEEEKLLSLYVELSALADRLTYATPFEQRSLNAGFTGLSRSAAMLSLALGDTRWNNLVDLHRKWKAHWMALKQAAIITAAEKLLTSAASAGKPILPENAIAQSQGAADTVKWPAFRLDGAYPIIQLPVIPGWSPIPTPDSTEKYLGAAPVELLKAVDVPAGPKTPAAKPADVKPVEVPVATEKPKEAVQPPVEKASEEKVVEKSAEKPVEKAVETPVEKAVETPAEKVETPPAEKPAKTASDAAVEAAVKEVIAEKPTEKAVEKPAEKATETPPTEKPAEKTVETPPVDKAAEKAVEPATEKPAEKTTETPPADKATEKPAEKAVEPATEKSAEKATETPPAENPIEKATETPPVEKAAEKPVEKAVETPPADKATEKPVEPATEKVMEKAAEPATEKPADKAAETPASEKPAEPATEKPAKAASDTAVDDALKAITP